MMRENTRSLVQGSPTGADRFGRWQTACLAVGLSIGLMGCSAEPPRQELTAEQTQLSAPPSAAPYLTDVNDDDPALEMRFGERDGQQSVGGVPVSKPDFNTELPYQKSAPMLRGAAKRNATELVAENDADEEAAPVGGPEDYTTWTKPNLTLVVTGQQHGYIEPCGCTGLDRQKGGVARRYTFMQQLRDKGWDLLPVDAGNLVRRFGRQAEVKLQQSVKALKAMGYDAVAFGPDDIRLGVGELLAVAAGESPEDTPYVSANVVLIDPSLVPQSKIVEKGGLRVGITSILDSKALEGEKSDDIGIEPEVESATKAVAGLDKKSCDFKVLMYFGKEDEAKEFVREVPGFDLIIVAGGYGEPTYRAEPIEGSQTKMIVTGNKGMYAGLVGLYEEEPMKYARVALTHEYKDAPEMRQLMREYQDQLRDIGLNGLGLLPPIPHSSGHKFVGTETCGKCHKTAFEIWEGTPHAHATDSIVSPPEDRGDVARHFDPECISCHVTGWNPQEYYPYTSGYLSLEQSGHLTGNGCENCHGPGAEHSAAEEEGSTVSEEERIALRNAMKLPLEKAREKCMTCHDLDNSPDFHEPDAFEDIYWPEVEHYGLD